MSTLIFCYGSLMKGLGNHRLLASSKLISEAMTEARFTMLSLGGFPGIVASGETAVKGEVYEVTDPVLAQLDLLESHPRWYVRTPMTVNGKDGNDYRVEAYVLPDSYLDDRYQKVLDGDWRGAVMSRSNS